MMQADKALAPAIQLLGQDQLTDAEIAEHVGVSRRTLARWKDRPGVQEQIARGRKLAKARFSRDVRRKANWMQRRVQLQRIVRHDHE